ncbi:unnamed protein product [Moneuplotes crassus]|uniref:Nudix hydrolase domain-containing protein n=1 Tax=Euplotes crassus TaxID=5936 RepID=A0AAD2D2C8_EUPCR|nr:unnamed protein product [Moneuplotes crassus]
MDRAKKLEEKLEEVKTVFTYTIDRYKGIKVAQDSLPDEKATFEDEMDKFMDELVKNKARSIWISIPIEKSSYIEAAASLGFEFHHTKGSVLVMSKWLDTRTESRLPGYTTHYCGVGGFVLNDHDEVLLIQERNPYGGTPFWKLPGGQVEENETLEQAVVREVKEETGVDAKVEGVISFRENPHYLFKTHDLYFVFLMSCKKDENVIQKQEIEIAECEWVPCKDLPRKLSLLSPMLQRITPIFDQDLEVAEKVIDGYRQEGTKQSMLNLMLMNNRPYTFRGRSQDMYLGKMIRDCMRAVSKI